MSHFLRSSVAFIFLIIAQTAAIACPSCYGAADSPMTAGMNAAILTMLGITGVVLTGISGMFFYIWRRMKQRRYDSNELFVNEH